MLSQTTSLSLHSHEEHIHSRTAQSGQLQATYPQLRQQQNSDTLNQGIQSAVTDQSKSSSVSLSNCYSITTNVNSDFKIVIKSCIDPGKIRQKTGQE